MLYTCTRLSMEPGRNKYQIFMGLDNHIQGQIIVLSQLSTIEEREREGERGEKDTDIYSVY